MKANIQEEVIVRYILSCFKWKGKQIIGNVLPVAAKLKRKFDT